MLIALLLAFEAVQAQTPPVDRPITVTGKATLDNASVLRAARSLKAGEFLWAPQTAPDGPMLMVVSLKTQRAVVYRNGLPIGITTVSSGKPGHETPVGIFTVLQKEKEHYSNLYNSAPMPFMQRLTWDGIALHAGNLPGHAASHGCIRLPAKFATLLYGQTRLGMTVVVTKRTDLPSIATAGDLIAAKGAPAATGVVSGDFWEPERASAGAVSIVVSTADRAMVVIRGGRMIGRMPVTVTRPVDRPYLYTYQAGTGGVAPRWTRIALPGQTADGGLQRGDVVLPPDRQAAVEALAVPGTTVVVTPDSLSTTATDLKGFVTGS